MILFRVLIVLMLTTGLSGCSFTATDLLSLGVRSVEHGSLEEVDVALPPRVKTSYKFQGRLQKDQAPSE